MAEFYSCKPCARDFDSFPAFCQHMETAPNHAWCFRCKESFLSFAEKEEHLEVSLNHNICYLCPKGKEPDFPTDGQFEHHWKKDHDYCRPCHQFFSSPNEHQEHNLAKHPTCTTCGDIFRDQSTLERVRMTFLLSPPPFKKPYLTQFQHAQSHSRKSQQCYGCEKMFGLKSSMILHLESGHCPSGMNLKKVKDRAYECYQSRHYRTEFEHEYPFKCPTCELLFPHMNSLLQHVEGGSCQERLERPSPLWKFLNYLSLRVRD
jgi:hypothetical protein